MTETTALIVIDVQAGVLDWPATGAAGEKMLANIGVLLTRARNNGIPVIYVQDNDMGLPVGSDGWQIHPAVAPQPGERVINKLACDSFYETDLAEKLTALGVTQLIICGCASQYCIDTSCRSAVAHGYPVTLAGDAHMTMSNGVISAEQIIAHTNRTLNGFGNAKAEITVMNTADIQFTRAETAGAN